MRNDFYRHKKSDKIKWVFTGIAFVLVFVFFVGLCMQLFGTGKIKPSEWFKKTECVHIDEDSDGKCDECGKEIPVENEDEKPEASDKFIVTSMNTKAMRLAVTPMAASANDGISTLAESGKTVSVLNAVEGYTYTWSLSSGGSEFVELSATTGTSVNVTAKKAFSTEITLTCTASLEGVSGSTATCTLGYYKRPDGLYLNGSYYNGTNVNIGTVFNSTNIKDALANETLTFASTQNDNGFCRLGAGTESFGDFYITATINEASTSFSLTLAEYQKSSKYSISFNEFCARYCMGKNYNQSSWDTGFHYNSSNDAFYNGACSKIFGTTFTVTAMYIHKTDSSRHVTLSYTFTVPSSWQMPYSVSVTDKVVL